MQRPTVAEETVLLRPGIIGRPTAGEASDLPDEALATLFTDTGLEDIDVWVGYLEATRRRNGPLITKINSANRIAKAPAYE